jgi:hypothetical protein
MSDFYENNTRHLHDNLVLVDLLLHREAMKSVPLLESMVQADGRIGHFVTGEKLEEIIAGEIPDSSWFESSVDTDSPDMKMLTDAIKALERDIHRREERSLVEGVELRLLRLSKLFQLSEKERKVLCIILAPQLNYRYERVFTYLQDDPLRRQPCVDLVLQIANGTFEEKISKESLFSPI